MPDIQTLEQQAKQGDAEAMYNIGRIFREYSAEIGRAHVRTPVTEKSRMPSSA